MFGLTQKHSSWHQVIHLTVRSRDCRAHCALTGRRATRAKCQSWAGNHSCDRLPTGPVSLMQPGPSPCTLSHHGPLHPQAQSFPGLAGFTPQLGGCGPATGPPWAYPLCQIPQPLRVGSSHGPAPCAVALPHCSPTSHKKKLRLGGGCSGWGPRGQTPKPRVLTTPHPASCLSLRRSPDCALPHLEVAPSTHCRPPGRACCSCWLLSLQARSTCVSPAS